MGAVCSSEVLVAMYLEVNMALQFKKCISAIKPCFAGMSLTKEAV
jgi:hypothetical protein